MSKPLDLSKPPFQTDEETPLKAELLRRGIKCAYDVRDVWLITTLEGIQFPAMRNQDGSGSDAGQASIVNAPRRIPFWILLNRQGNMVSTLKPASCSNFRGPFYMDEDGNPVKGEGER